jgi:hypothetical protein
MTKNRRTDSTLFATDDVSMTVLCATSELDVAGRCDELSVDLGVVRDGRQLGSRAVCDRTRIFSVLPLNLTSPSTIEVHHKKETIPVIIYFPVKELYDDKHSF